jgi:hypothetical protein
MEQIGTGARLAVEADGTCKAMTEDRSERLGPEADGSHDSRSADAEHAGVASTNYVWMARAARS